jgi:site-specific DNA-methyltransferase (adenine-specific)
MNSNSLNNIYSEDCIDSQKKIKDNSVHLGIFDPPFGIKETGFDKHYKRDNSNVIQGYKEAPDDYEQWTHLWLSEAKRVLRPDGSMYIFMGHSKLRHVLNAAHNLGLHEINHIVWKYNFGVYTKKKYVTSHYHILHYSKSKKTNPTFNLNCRFGSQEKDKHGGSLLYQDLEDVFIINRDYAPKQKKNQNKLPEELIRKLIMYSSNEKDMICDFFMGNFTTAYTALKLGRRVCGYEMNKKSFDYHIGKLQQVEFGCDLKNMKKVENIVPPNQGKKITTEEFNAICNDYIKMNDGKMKKCDISLQLQTKFGRGRFAIKNILDKYFEQLNNNKNLSLTNSCLTSSHE